VSGGEASGLSSELSLLSGGELGSVQDWILTGQETGGRTQTHEDHLAGVQLCQVDSECPCSPFCSGYFGDGVSQTTFLSWPLTTVLPISASQIARITGVSHQHPGGLAS
jgi:hypothetical protein